MFIANEISPLPIPDEGNLNNSRLLPVFLDKIGEVEHGNRL
jgi:hypothetical protein